MGAGEAGLTRAQRVVLDCIRRHVLERGHSPSIREIARGIGQPGSVGSIHENVQKLVRAGALSIDPVTRRIILRHANFLILPLSDHFRAVLDAAARRAGTTAEALAIEYIRERVFGSRSVLRETSSRASAAPPA